MPKKPAVRPPRKPRGEPAKVTIGVLERQVAELTARIGLLVDQRDEAIHDIARARVTSESVTRDLDNERAFATQLNNQLNALTERFEGYRMCVRDTKP